MLVVPGLGSLTRFCRVTVGTNGRKVLGSASLCSTNWVGAFWNCEIESRTPPPSVRSVRPLQPARQVSARAAIRVVVFFRFILGLLPGLQLDDPRGDKNQQLFVRVRPRAVLEQVAQDGDVGEAGDAVLGVV